MDKDKIFTLEEAAEYLRLFPLTTYKLLRNGKLPGAKVGRQWRIRKADLDAYLQGQLVPAKTKR